MQFRTWNYDGVTWYTQRNWYEGVQWTLAYELRGSFVVYLALVVTVGFTPFTRVMSFFAIIAYSIYCDVDTLLNLPFFSGVLLADLSLVLAGTDSSSSSSYKGFSGRLGRCLNWRVALGLVGLFIGSYPPDAPELSAWARFITRVGEPFLRSDCIQPLQYHTLTIRGTGMGVHIDRYCHFRVCHSILCRIPLRTLPSHRGVPRKYLVPDVSHSLFSHEIIACLGRIRRYS